MTQAIHNMKCGKAPGPDNSHPEFIKNLGPLFHRRKFYAEQLLDLLRTERMQLRNHVDTQRVKRSKR